jgi:hypothetical protein
VANPITWPTEKQALWLAKETTQGTAVLTSMAQMPVDSFAPSDLPTWLDDTAMRNAMAGLYGRSQGPIHVEFELSGPAYMDMLGYFLNNILGDLTTTGASAPFTHAFSLLNSGGAQPGSLTLVQWQGTPATSACRSFAGCCLSELSLSGNADSEFISFSCKGSAWLSADVPTAAPASALTGALPMPTWRFLVGQGGPASGGSQVKTVREFSFTMTRALRVENTMQNAQTPFIIQRGALTTSGSLTYTTPADEAPLDPLLNNSQPQLQILGTQGAAATTLALTIDALLSAWDTATIKLDEEAVGYDVAFVGVGNATNVGASGGFSPCKVTLQNAIPANTY